MILFIVKAFIIATTAFASDVYVPDSSLIRQWDKAFYAKHMYQPFPRVIYFLNVTDGKSLTYVAAKHTDITNTTRLVKKVIEENKPDIILIEGIHEAWGISPKEWDDKTEVTKHEGYFTCKMAQQNKIPYLGAELLGKMSEHSSYERDVAVLKSLADLLSKHKKVMIVYGAGHYVQQERALIKMLGKPIRIE